MLKSLTFRVNNTKLRDMAIAAILKSIVDTRTRCDRIPPNISKLRHND
ncbi:MAG: hypothetical protein V7K64_10960 [Nostoc sp.]|nr:hypothetical protein [Nostoc sp. JL34]MBN3884759.1 hypothetical protein [Nostoc sp. JL34]